MADTVMRDEAVEGRHMRRKSMVWTGEDTCYANMPSDSGMDRALHKTTDGFDTAPTALDEWIATSRDA